MNESRAMLRQRFQAQTDVEIDPEPANWKRYSLWLEELAIGELNNELVKENEVLRKVMLKAMNVLALGIVGAHVKKTHSRRRKPR